MSRVKVRHCIECGAHGVTGKGVKYCGNCCPSCPAHPAATQRDCGACVEAWNAWKSYRVPPLDWWAMRAYDQCDVCEDSMNGDKPFIDHNHNCCPGDKSCGTCVRGLLCRGCNTAEGHLSGDAEKAMKLAAFILDGRSY